MDAALSKIGMEFLGAGAVASQFMEAGGAPVVSVPEGAVAVGISCSESQGPTMPQIVVWAIGCVMLYELSEFVLRMV